LAKVLEKFGDPDWRFPLTLRGGVAIGVDEELPRTPGVYEEKVKWALNDSLDEPEHMRDNYKTMAGQEEQVQRLFESERDLGWMEELTEDEAMKRYGNKLYVASLAVVDEVTKVRVVHDATHGVALNNRIKVRDQVRYPGAGEIRCILEERRARGQKGFFILGDASKAHRRISVRPSGWGFWGARCGPALFGKTKSAPMGLGPQATSGAGSRAQCTGWGSTWWGTTGTSRPSCSLTIGRHSQEAARSSRILPGWCW